MVLISVLCPHCHSDHVIKGGKTKAGQQREKCQNTDCPRSSLQRDLFYKGRTPAIKEQIVAMRLNGSGIRDTARVLKMSPTTVINPLKKKSLLSSRCINRSSPRGHLRRWTWCFSELKKRKSMRCGPPWRRRPRRAGCGTRSITRQAGAWRMAVADGKSRCFCNAKRSASLLGSPAITPIIGARTPGIWIPTSTMRASATRRRSSANL